MLDKMKQTFGDGAAIAGTKLSLFWKTNKISSQISRLEQEIQAAKIEMADAVYNFVLQSGDYTQVVADYCTAIREKKVQIAALQKQLSEAKAEAQSAIEQRKSAGLQPSDRECPNCGMQNPPDAAFCLQCGRKF